MFTSVEKLFLIFPAIQIMASSIWLWNLQVNANAAAGAFGVCTLRVQFPSFNNAAITATTTVTVVTVSAVTLRSQHYDVAALPTDLTTVGTKYTRLAQIACIPTDFEQVSLVKQSDDFNCFHLDVRIRTALSLSLSHACVFTRVFPEEHVFN